MFMRGKETIKADQVKPDLRVAVVLAEADKTAEHLIIGAEARKK